MRLPIFNNGHSKDALSLQNKNGELYVEKCTPLDLNRASENVTKQLEFQEFSEGLVSLKACPIIHYEKNESVTIKMPYIDGIVAADFALMAGSKIVVNLNIVLSNYLRSNINNSIQIDFPKQIFLDKLRLVREKSSSDFKKYFLLCEDLIQENTQSYLEGNCHGDLTLSNVICESANSYYLIDFLKTYSESPLQDLSKILQERKYGWSFRHDKKAIVNRGLIFCEAAFPDPYQFLPKCNHQSLRICELLTLLRIAPYLSDLVSRNWLKDSLNKFNEGL
jgi:thiamine kinase-like enzyme